MSSPFNGVGWFRQMFAFDQWANERVLNQLEADQVTDTQCHQWMSHLVSAHLGWQSRWLPDKVFPSLTVVRTPAENLALLRAFYEETGNLLDTFSDQDLLRTVSYTNTRGETYTNTLAEIWGHVVNHATHHRGQCVARIRALGMVPVPTDLIVFLRNK
jgi:uncharacterized damage-inducible protein DinB